MCGFLLESIAKGLKYGTPNLPILKKRNACQKAMLASWHSILCEFEVPYIKFYEFATNSYETFGKSIKFGMIY